MCVCVRETVSARVCVCASVRVRVRLYVCVSVYERVRGERGWREAEKVCCPLRDRMLGPSRLQEQASLILCSVSHSHPLPPPSIPVFRFMVALRASQAPHSRRAQHPRRRRRRPAVDSRRGSRPPARSRSHRGSLRLSLHKVCTQRTKGRLVELCAFDVPLEPPCIKFVACSLTRFHHQSRTCVARHCRSLP